MLLRFQYAESWDLEPVFVVEKPRALVADFFIFPDGWTILPPPGKQETASCSGSNCGLARERNQHCNFGQAGHSVPVGVAISPASHRFRNSTPDMCRFSQAILSNRLAASDSLSSTTPQGASLILTTISPAPNPVRSPE